LPSGPWGSLVWWIDVVPGWVGLYCQKPASNGIRICVYRKTSVGSVVIDSERSGMSAIHHGPVLWTWGNPAYCRAIALAPLKGA
jgi:hypothetical protein